MNSGRDEITGTDKVTAYSRVYDAYSPKVYAFILQYAREPHASEILYNVFLHGWRHFKPGINTLSWFMDRAVRELQQRFPNDTITIITR